MKFFVTGVCGQLGHDVMNELSKRGYEAVGTDIQPESAFGNYIRLDITDGKAVREAIAAVKPDAVIHCAAWTAVDAAEDAENKPKVYAVNVTGTGHIAAACKETGCKPRPFRSQRQNMA